MSARGIFGLHVATPEEALAALGREILAEKAAALGRAGLRAKEALDRLRGFEGEGEARVAVRGAAAEAVQAYFIQRELCGLRRHDDIIRELGVPKEVLVRLGAR